MIVVGNGRLVSRTPDHPWYEDGAVAIDGTQIEEVGKSKEIRAAYPDAEFIDAKGGVIMPAFINAHEHIYSAFARGLSIRGYDPKNFLDVLDGMWWTIDRNLTNEATRMSARVTFLDAVKSGVTTVFDHHASYGQIKDSLFAIEDAAKEFGVRCALCFEVSDREGREKARQAVLENEAWINHALADKRDMIAGMMGLHAQFTISDETFAYAAAHKPEGTGYHIHVAEGIEDLQDCLRRHGKRIVERLMDFDITGRKSLFVHCIYVSPHEMDLIRATDTMVVHNPQSNMGNACGAPPVLQMMKKGILTGLGTDGFTTDMLESAKTAGLLHKHHLGDAKAGMREVPQMLFSNNARIAARYFKRPLGVLRPGAAADVIVLDYDPRTPMSADNIDAHILFGMSGRDVVTTIGNGRVLMKNREVVGIDEERVYYEARKEAARLAERING